MPSYLYDFLKLYLKGIVEGALTIRAAAISFSLFMAIFPFLLFLLNLIPFVPVDNFQQEFIAIIQKVIPSVELSELITSIFEDIANNKRGSLLSSVFFLSLLLASNGVNAILGGFDYSYHLSKVKVGVLKKHMTAVGVTVLLTLLLLFVLSLGIFLEYYLRGIGTELEVYWGQWGWAVRYLFLILLIYLTATILYYFGTNGCNFSFFSKGATITTFLVILTTYLFGIYIENFNNYNELYGSIGAVMVLMLYLWLNSIIFLLGFDVDASLHSLENNKA